MLDGAMQSLLPLGVCVAATSTRTDPAQLWIAEERYVASAVPARRSEFATGRSCARLALGRLGVEACAIGVGEHREPLWPAGVVGSITHCAGYCAAAVGLTDRWLALGIDAEQRRALEPEVAALVLTDGERAELEALASRGIDVPPIAIFSIKEAVFKAWWPLTRGWLEFADVDVSLAQGPAQSGTTRRNSDLATGRFRARLGAERGRAATAIDGTFAIHEHLVLAAVALPRSTGPPCRSA